MSRICVRVAVSAAFLSMLTACGASGGVDELASDAGQSTATPAGEPAAGGLDCGDSNETVAFVDEPDLTQASGWLSPEESVDDLRRRERLNLPPQASAAYFRGQSGERVANSGQKVFEYRGQGRRGPQAKLMTEQIQGKWFATSYIACVSAAPASEVGQ